MSNKRIVSAFATLVFGLMVIAGSFGTTHAMTSMTEDEMSGVTGQEGLEMDLHLGSSFSIDEIDYKDADGYTGASGNAGVVGIHGISPTGSFDIEGITVDADPSVSVGGTTQGAVVVGIPSVPSGITIDAIDPGGGDDATISATPEGNSLGSVTIGGINVGSSSRVEVASN